MQTHSTCSRAHRIAARFLPGLLVLATACSGTTLLPTGEFASESDVTQAVVPGLEQRVTLSPAELVTGENVTIRSVITNHGAGPVALESRICGLTLDGDIRLEWPPGLFVCAGFSMGGTIAPGESRESTEIRRIASPSGGYTLHVKHALQPERWVEMRVVVRER